MDFLLLFTTHLIVFLGVVNLLRMSLFLIGSDVYTLKRRIASRKKTSSFRPKVSVVIPAFNEGASIIACMKSVLKNTYPAHLREVIIVDDGSTDDTQARLYDYLLKNPDKSVKVITQPNLGKAHALNNGMKNHATGDLVMCLDADSYLSPTAIQNAVAYFEKKEVKALAANVKISKSKSLLNLVQTFEYIVCYQMKKSQTAFNIEYIIGGIGSMFRKSYLEEIGYYDGDTVTEDIDLTMKILRKGNKKVKVIYGADVIAYTQGALTLADLIKQRYRWKWGRYQTFLKNKSMFFSRKKSFTKGLSWFYLPFALFCDVTFFLEPLVVGYMIYLIAIKQDFFTLLSACLIISFYLTMNILAEETISRKDKAKMIALAPLMYFLFYILSYVEYLALIKSLVKMPSLNKSLSQNICSWEPVKRVGLSTLLNPQNY